MRLSRQRVYPIESLILDFNRILNEDQGNEIARLGILLGIGRDHPLAESLLPIVYLTKGENMKNTNPLFHRVVALENADDLVGTLTSEYGHKQGTSWNRNNRNVVFFMPEAFADAKDYLNFTNTKYKVMKEEPEDKFV